MRPLACSLAYSLGLLASGCIAVTDGKLRPGLLRDLSTASRETDPTADPNAELRRNPWTEAPRAPPRPGSRQEWIETTAATVAGVLAGAMPAIMYSGTFDENRLFVRPLPPRRTGDDGEASSDAVPTSASQQP